VRLLSFLLVLSVAPSAWAAPTTCSAPPCQLNAGGGGGNALELTVGGTGQIQVIRGTYRQFYSEDGSAPMVGNNSNIDNGVFLNVNDQCLIGPRFGTFDYVPDAQTTPTDIAKLQEWSPGPMSGTWSGTSGAITQTLSGKCPAVTGPTYSAKTTYTYDVADDFVHVKMEVSAPGGTAFKLYHAFDTNINGTGGDFGPTYFSNNTLVAKSLNFYAGYRFTPMTSGPMRTHYYAGTNMCMFAPWGGQCPTSCSRTAPPT